MGIIFGPKCVPSAVIVCVTRREILILVVAVVVVGVGASSIITPWSRLCGGLIPSTWTKGVREGASWTTASRKWLWDMLVSVTVTKVIRVGVSLTTSSREWPWAVLVSVTVTKAVHVRVSLTTRLREWIWGVLVSVTLLIVVRVRIASAVRRLVKFRKTMAPVSIPVSVIIFVEVSIKVFPPVSTSVVTWGWIVFVHIPLGWSYMTIVVSHNNQRLRVNKEVWGSPT